MNIIRIEGSDKWEDGYRMGLELDKLFPGCAIDDLCSAVSHHQSDAFGWDDMRSMKTVTLSQEGENDGPSWIWNIELLNGRKLEVEGWCDYTGWDCQSGIEVRER